jgi:hypothetical protein
MKFFTESIWREASRRILRLVSGSEGKGGRRAWGPGLQGRAAGCGLGLGRTLGLGPCRVGPCRGVGGRFAVFEDLKPMDPDGSISVWKGSRAKGFDQLDELVAAGWNAFEKDVG